MWSRIVLVDFVTTVIPIIDRNTSINILLVP